MRTMLSLLRDSASSHGLQYLYLEAECCLSPAANFDRYKRGHAYVCQRWCRFL